MIDFSIKKPITTLMILMTLVVFGFYTYRLLTVDLMPDITLPIATVQVVYPGAGPEEIETSVVSKIEDELAMLDGLDKNQVFIMDGVAVFVLEFDMEQDIDIAAMDIKDKIDAIRSELPEDIMDPVVSKVDLGAFPVMLLSLSGPEGLDRTRYWAEELVQPELTKISGVAQVDIAGGLEREIHVDLIGSELESRGMAYTDVYQVLAANNLKFPLGSMENIPKDVTLRLDGEFTSLEQLRELLIPTSSGPVPLKTVAFITDSFKEVEQKAYYTGSATVGLSMIKRSDANVVGVCQQVTKDLSKIEAKLPEGYKLSIIRDNSLFIENSVNDTFNNIYLGIILTAAILFFFLRNFNTTIIAAVTMPITVITTFTMVYASGFTLNIMTLMSLGLSVGLLVTNTIVVIENIIKHLNQKHDDPMHAAAAGTKEVATAVFASTLTNMAVFVPIAFMQGIMGKIFLQFGMTMVYATIASLLISFTLTPMMASRMLKTGKKKEKKELQFLKVLENGYRNILEKLVSGWGLAGMVVLLVVLFISVGVLGGHLGSEFMPKTDEGLIDIKVEMPSGTNLDATNAAAILVENKIKNIKEIKAVYTQVGSSNPMEGGASTASLAIELVGKDNRDRSTDQVVASIRPLLADIPAAEITVMSKQSMGEGGGGQEGDLQVQITGPELEKVVAASDSVDRLLRSLNGVANVKSTWKEGAPELVLRPRQDVLADYGVTAGQIAQFIRYYVEGEDASIYRENGEEYDILLRFREEDRKSRTDILGLTLPTARGFIPLSVLVEEQNSTGPSQLNRLNKEPLITLGTFLFPDITAGEVQTELLAKVDAMNLPEGVKVSFGGDAEMMAESITEMTLAMLMAIILTYILLTALLESFIQPLVIMMTIPLGFIGVIWSLFFSGNSISIISLMAMVMLIGIVVNNAILIIDYANYLTRKKDMNPREAAIEGASSKFRAILMTNIATIVSMLPLALGLGEGAEMRQPMAIASIGGLMVSTLMTIFFIPQLFWFTPKISSLAGRVVFFWRKRTV